MFVQKDLLNLSILRNGKENYRDPTRLKTLRTLTRKTVENRGRPITQDMDEDQSRRKFIVETEWVENLKTVKGTDQFLKTIKDQPN